MTEWTLIYSDCEVEGEGFPGNVPKKGLLCIVTKKDTFKGPVKIHILKGQDYYYYSRENDRWYSTSNPASALEHHRKENCLVHGEEVSDEEYEEARLRAMEKYR